MTPTEKDPAYWRERAKTGAKALQKFGEGTQKRIESPAQLWQYACEYFERQAGKPWLKKDYKGKDAIEVEIPTSAPFLWSGLDDYLFEKGVISSLKDYKTGARNHEYKEGAYAAYSEVIRVIGDIMTSQKLEGAMVGAYNPNLVARLEGLQDKTETTGEITVKQLKVGYE